MATSAFEREARHDTQIRREGPEWLVGFSPDGRLLVTRSADETIMLWHVGLSELVAIAGRTAGRQLTVKEASEIIALEMTRPCVDQPTAPSYKQ